MATSQEETSNLKTKNGPEKEVEGVKVERKEEKKAVEHMRAEPTSKPPQVSYGHTGEVAAVAIKGRSLHGGGDSSAPCRSCSIKPVDEEWR